jgi:dGTPase
MFANVYQDSPAKFEEDKARRIVSELFNLYVEKLKPICEKSKIERIVIDYIAGMTDRYAVERFEELFIPKGLSQKAFGKSDEYLFKLATAAG